MADMSPAVTGAVLDHVAVAVERWSDAWPTYVTGLGGRWSSGGLGIGFSPAQLRFANAARLEVLAPNQVDRNDFLRRFLDRSGPGPHHFTFKVPDIHRALAAAEAAGFVPEQVDLSDPDWLEAFLHPRQARGVVVQLAQAAGGWESPPPEGFPVPGEPPAAFTHVTHAVADLDDGLSLFAGLLGGAVTDLGAGPDGTWRTVDLRWGGPLGVRLVAPTTGDSALAAWLGGRAGRVHHLAFAAPSPGPGREASTVRVPGVTDADGPVLVREPETNLGVRVVVRQAERAPAALQ